MVTFGKKILFILAIISLNAIVVLALFTTSKNFNKKKNGFERIFNQKIINQSAFIDLKYYGYYIAGITSTNIYLGNNPVTSHLLVSNFKLTDTKHLKLKFDTSRFAWGAFKNVIDSPNIYMIERITPSLKRTSLPLFQIYPYDTKNISFSLAVPVSVNSFILRVPDKILRQNILIKKIFSTPTIIKAPILEKQVDGFFCTDGMLLYNKEFSRLIYLYYYRNQFICLDTNLNILYRNHTIDTVSKAKIKVEEIKSENSLTIADPPVQVNKKSYTTGNYLFVISELMSDNENESTFRNSSVIDIYSIQNGKYMYSCYLPNFKKSKISDFAVSNNYLFAIFGHYLCVYELNL